MIKLIIFDAGGVLVTENKEEIRGGISNYLGINRKVLDKLIDKFNRKATTGEISLLEMYSRILKEIKSQRTAKEVLDKYIQIYKKTIKRNKEILDLIIKLRESFLVVCLTNTEIEIAELNKKRKTFSIFHNVYYSTDLHLMKPDYSIYKFVLKNLKCKPRDTIFIDDKKEYVEAARKIGIKGIFYKKPKQLKERLYSLASKK